MDKHLNYFKIAGIANIVVGAIATTSLKVYGIIIILIGIALLYLSTNKNEKLSNNRGLVLTLAIISIFTNILSTIILVFALFKMKGNYPVNSNSINAPPSKKVIVKKKVIDPEVKKIDTLLKLGVAMVFISGVLFATTSWEFISDLFKAVALMILGTLFICLSGFSEKKLKLYNTTFMYWILGLSFYLLTIVGMLYFGLAGEALTYSGTNSSLAYAITFFTLSGLTMATYLKFSNKTYLHISYASIVLVLTFIFNGLKLQPITIILIITILSILINIFSNKNSTLYKFNKVLSYILIGYTISNVEDSNEIIYLITSILGIGNISYASFKNNENNTSIINLIISYFLMLLAIEHLTISDNMTSIILYTIPMVYTLLMRYNVFETTEGYRKSNYILFALLTFALIIQAFSFAEYLPLLISGTFLIINFIYRQKLVESKETKISNSIEPIIIFFTILSTTRFDIFSDIKLSTIVAITTFTYTIIYAFTKKKNYTIYSYIGILLYFLLTLDKYDTFVTVLMMLPCAYYLCICLNDNQISKEKKVAAFIITMYSIYNNLYILDIFNMSEIISSLIVILTLLVAIVGIKDDDISKTSYFLLVIPLYNIVQALSEQDVITQIATSILGLYITFLVAKFFCSNQKSKDTIAILGISLSLLPVIFTTELIVGLYVGLIGIITTMIGYYNKESKSVFITGIIITVINIIIQLIDLWEQIPFWLYLLVCGLGLIFFVTYKEIKKMNEKK